MIKTRPGEGLFLAVLLLGLAWLLPEALKLPGVFQGQWAGPGSVAQLLLVGMLVLTGGLLLTALRTGSPAVGATVQYLLSRDAALLLLTAVAYAIAIVPIGFETATFGFLVAAMYLLDPQRFGHKALVAAGTVGTIYVIFARLFAVILP
jgi:hypothetical protein